MNEVGGPLRGLFIGLQHLVRIILTKNKKKLDEILHETKVIIHGVSIVN